MSLCNTLYKILSLNIGHSWYMVKLKSQRSLTAVDRLQKDLEQSP